MADIVLVNPRFEVSFWGLEHVLPLLHKRASMPVAGLALLAALTPSEHRVRITDENVEPLDFERLTRADIVGVTGMSVQRLRMREILIELQKRKVFTVVGGPWVSVNEDYFGSLAKVIFVGEAEEAWPRFLGDWQEGRYQSRYAQVEKTDMTRVPLPRYDLLRMRRYLFGSVQFSRGCPFHCEFCDVIVTFGHRPRFKTSAQILRELDALRAQKMEISFIVDDNFVGHKEAIKAVLREVAAWQQAHGYPFIFVAEASLDLADDKDLMRLMVEANIQSVFIGIESPNEESLREAKKYQNLGRGSTLLERIRAIQDAGLEVWSGMIVGFDNDDTTIFASQREFVRQARIVDAMIGMLYAIPKTGLYHRLIAAGRLDSDDHSDYGTNVIPLRMSREELRDGYLQLMQELFAPEAYFGRLDNLLLRDNFQLGQSQARYWRKHAWTRTTAQTTALLRSAFLYWQLTRRLPQPILREEYRRRIAGLWKCRRDPFVLFAYLLKCAMHYHHWTMARAMALRRSPIVNTY